MQHGNFQIQKAVMECEMKSRKTILKYKKQVLELKWGRFNMLKPVLEFDNQFNNSVFVFRI